MNISHSHSSSVPGPSHAIRRRLSHVLSGAVTGQTVSEKVRAAIVRGAVPDYIALPLSEQLEQNHTKISQLTVEQRSMEAALEENQARLQLKEEQRREEQRKREEILQEKEAMQEKVRIEIMSIRESVLSKEKAIEAREGDLELEFKTKQEQLQQQVKKLGKRHSQVSTDFQNSQALYQEQSKELDDWKGKCAELRNQLLLMGDEKKALMVMQEKLKEEYAGSRQEMEEVSRVTHKKDKKVIMREIFFPHYLVFDIVCMTFV